MEEIPSNARSWNLTTSEVRHRISGSMLFKVCELFHYVSGVKISKPLLFYCIIQKKLSFL